MERSLWHMSKIKQKQNLVKRGVFKNDGNPIKGKKYTNINVNMCVCVCLLEG